MCVWVCACECVHVQLHVYVFVSQTVCDMYVCKHPCTDVDDTETSSLISALYNLSHFESAAYVYLFICGCSSPLDIYGCVCSSSLSSLWSVFTTLKLLNQRLIAGRYISISAKFRSNLLILDLLCSIAAIFAVFRGELLYIFLLYIIWPYF